MKTYHSNYTAYPLTVVCLLFATMFGTSQAADPTAKSHRAVVTRSGSSERSVGDGRLIVRRIPTLGNNVIVDLYIDGVALAAVGYGHTYEGSLPVGRHVLSVRPGPSPKWPGEVWQTTLEVRNGDTYSFTAMDDGSGGLILKGT